MRGVGGHERISCPPTAHEAEVARARKNGRARRLGPGCRRRPLEKASQSIAGQYLRSHMNDSAGQEQLRHNQRTRGRKDHGLARLHGGEGGCLLGRFEGDPLVDSAVIEGRATKDPRVEAPRRVEST